MFFHHLINSDWHNNSVEYFPLVFGLVLFAFLLFLLEFSLYRAKYLIILLNGSYNQ